MPDEMDGNVYMAGAIGILGEYPAEVYTAVCDPVIGTRYLKDRPMLSQIRQACEAVYAPIGRAKDREWAKAHRMPPIHLEMRTNEKQAAVDAQVARVRKQFGLPQRGLERRVHHPTHPDFGLMISGRLPSYEQQEQKLLPSPSEPNQAN